MLPVVAVVRPAALLCTANGELPVESLRSIGVAGQLEASCAYDAWNALWSAAQEVAIELTWTYGGTYRSLSMQERLFLQRWQTTPIPRETALWAGQKWYLRYGVSRAAVPGTSNHGWGLAVDVAAGASPDEARSISPHMPWLIDNAIGFGWSWESQSEPWHLRYWAGDATPERVEAFKTIVAQSATQPS